MKSFYRNAALAAGLMIFGPLTAMAAATVSLTFDEQGLTPPGKPFNSDKSSQNYMEFYYSTANDGKSVTIKPCDAAATRCNDALNDPSPQNGFTYDTSNQFQYPDPAAGPVALILNGTITFDTEFNFSKVQFYSRAEAGKSVGVSGTGIGSNFSYCSKQVNGTLSDGWCFSEADAVDPLIGVRAVTFSADTLVLDDIVFTLVDSGQPTIPEPTSISLVGLALLGTELSRRQRKA